MLEFMSTQGQWNDIKCDNYNRYACKIEYSKYTCTICLIYRLYLLENYSLLHNIQLSRVKTISNKISHRYYEI